MKYIFHLFLWILTFFLTLSAFAFLPGPAGFLSLLLIAVVIPLEEWQDLLKKYTRRWLRPLAATALSAVLFFSSPALLPAELRNDMAAPPPAANSSAAVSPATPVTPAVPETPAAPIVEDTAQEELPPAETTPPSQQAVPPAAMENDTLVWIPTRGGVKYHTHAGCSDMIDPLEVSVSTAISGGFDPCKKCYQ